MYIPCSTEYLVEINPRQPTEALLLFPEQKGFGHFKTDSSPLPIVSSVRSLFPRATSACNPGLFVDDDEIKVLFFM
jgi:hypothetical protein